MYKLYLIVLLFLFMLSGCKIQKTSTDLSTTDTVTTTITPTHSISSTPTITPFPTFDVQSGDQLTVQAAQSILKQKENAISYNYTLLSEDLTINKQSYYSFIATLNSTPLEPVLLVNKENATVSCLSMNGDILPYSEFPYTKEDPPIEYNWSGAFIRSQADTTNECKLYLLQNDTTSFEFYIEYLQDQTTQYLSGIGHIRNQTACFTDEAGNELAFAMKDNSITVITDASLSADFDPSGTYYLEADYITDPLPCLSVKDALALLKKQDPETLKLTEDVSSYQFDYEDAMIIIEDRICYKFVATKESEMIATYYMSIDGNVVYYSTGNNSSYISITL